MSCDRTKTIIFKHSFDCTQAGCPGHEMFLKIRRTSETMCIVVDGSEHLIFEDEFKEAVKLYIEDLLK